MTEGNNEISGLDFLNRLRLRWLLGAKVFGCVFFCIAVVVTVIPNKYEARLKIAVKNERIDPFVGSDKQTQSILNVNDVSEPRINTEIQLLTSSKVLREVVEKCRLTDSVGMKRRPEAQREELALRQLQKDLVVAPVRNSNVIEVSYEATDPHRSAEVVNSVWQAYSLASGRMHGVPGSLGFFERLSTEYDAKLAEAQKNLSNFRTAHDVVSLPDEQTLALANAAHLRSQMADSAAEEQRTAATASRLKREMDVLPANVERDRRSMPNQALTQQLTSLLVTLQNKRTELALRYQPGDRLLKELDAEISRTEAALAQAEKSAADEVSVAANPAMDVARSEYIRNAAAGAGAQAQTDQIARQLQKDRASLSSLTAQSAKYKELVQRVSELEELDQEYHKKADEAHFEKSLDEQQISNLALVDEPYVSAVPSSPRRGLLLSLGLLWSAFLALVVVSVVETLAARELKMMALGSPELQHTQTALQTYPESLSDATRGRMGDRLPISDTRLDPSQAVATGIDEEWLADSIHLFMSDPDASISNERIPVGVRRSEGVPPRAGFPEMSARSTTIHSAFQLEQAIKVPVLANIPESALPPPGKSFSALYLAVQRGSTSFPNEVQR